jgi:DNA-binding LytR/AlgR family response regulator
MQVGAMSLRHLVAKRDGKLCFLPPADIACVVADRNYLVIHARGQRYSTRWTMKEAQSALAAFSFVRVHRSILLNLTHVQTIERLSPGRYLFTLQDGAQFISGRNYSRQMRALLSNAAEIPAARRPERISGTSRQ